jgi:hypothetical protein
MMREPCEHLKRVQELFQYAIGGVEVVSIDAPVDFIHICDRIWMQGEAH